MDLVLWRHCDAAPGVPDDGRPLTPRGLGQAARIAQWLGPRLPDAARILVSPALRAQQTAAALGRPFETHAGAGTDTTIDALLDVVQWPHARTVVLVVGHQPVLGRTASLLVDGDATDRAIATGEVVWLASIGEDGRARVAAAMAPDAVRPAPAG